MLLIRYYKINDEHGVIRMNKAIGQDTVVTWDEKDDKVLLEEIFSQLLNTPKDELLELRDALRLISEYMELESTTMEITAAS
jgi:hypothetical protein